MNTDAKILNQILAFLIKTLQTRIEENFLDLVKGIYKNPMGREWT